MTLNMIFNILVREEEILDQTKAIKVNSKAGFASVMVSEYLKARTRQLIQVQDSASLWQTCSFDLL